VDTVRRGKRAVKGGVSMVTGRGATSCRWEKSGLFSSQTVVPARRTGPDLRLSGEREERL